MQLPKQISSEFVISKNLNEIDVNAHFDSILLRYCYTRQLLQTSANCLAIVSCLISVTSIMAIPFTLYESAIPNDSSNLYFKIIFLLFKSIDGLLWVLIDPLRVEHLHLDC